MQDIDSAPGFALGEAVTVTWHNISLDGAACVTFSGLFAEAMASDGKTDIDSDDYIHVDYSIDGGATWVPLLYFQSSSLDINGVFRLDRDLDGQGDLTERALNDTAYRYSAVSQPLNGASTLALRLSVLLTANDEDAGFDTFGLVASSCVALTTNVDLGPILFFESFDTKAAMVVSPGFASSDSGSNYFGLTGRTGTVRDFGGSSTLPRLQTYRGETLNCSRVFALHSWFMIMF